MEAGRQGEVLGYSSLHLKFKKREEKIYIRKSPYRALSLYMGSRDASDLAQSGEALQGLWFPEKSTPLAFQSLSLETHRI